MINKFIQFLHNSPSSYHAINNVKSELEKMNNFSTILKIGKCSYFTKESKHGATLVAVNIGKNVKEDAPFNIIASHADSPWFLIKKGNKKLEGLNVIKAVRYGGPILSSWYDRPLTLAGRVIIKEKSKKLTKYVHLENETLLIPNLSIHFAKYIKDKTLIINGNPVIGTENNLLSLLSKNLNVKEKDIISFDLNTICKMPPMLWGDNNEFLSSQRLDDLASVFTSLEAFKNNSNDNAINVLYISDNEEIGSKTDVGAFSKFLLKSLKEVYKSLHLSFDKALKHSFLISADNAQAVSPYFGYIYNKKFKIYLNKGLAIKRSEKYATSEESEKLFSKYCIDHSLNFQLYRNRKDIPGGGTIGKIVQSYLPILGVDVGIPQLAMHSSFETIGVKDLENAFNVFSEFYKDFLLSK